MGHGGILVWTSINLETKECVNNFTLKVMLIVSFDFRELLSSRPIESYINTQYTHKFFPLSFCRSLRPLPPSLTWWHLPLHTLAHGIPSSHGISSPQLIQSFPYWWSVSVSFFCPYQKIQYTLTNISSWVLALFFLGINFQKGVCWVQESLAPEQHNVRSTDPLCSWKPECNLGQCSESEVLHLQSQPVGMV